MFPHISDNFFFHHLKLSLLWPTLVCGTHYDNCQVLPHSLQHKDYKAHPQHLLYKAPGSSLFWKLLYCRTTSICHPTPRGLSKYCLFSTSRNSLTLLFSGLFTGCQYLQEFYWKHRFWLTLLPMLPLPPLPPCLYRAVSLHMKGSCLFSSRNFFILVFDFHIVLKGNFYVTSNFYVPKI